MEKFRQVIEVERIVNLIRGFGWGLIKEEVEGETIRLIIEKKVESE